MEKQSFRLGDLVWVDGVYPGVISAVTGRFSDGAITSIEAQITQEDGLQLVVN